MKKTTGFTLQELLISLAILSLIAVFTIPKVLQSNSVSTKNAVFKETIALLNELTYNGYNSGELYIGNEADYYLNKINAILVCPGRSEDQGCWPPDSDLDSSMAGNQEGVVLPSGAMIAGLNNQTVGSISCNRIAIDWNGLKGPNQDGIDEIAMTVSPNANPPFGGGGANTCTNVGAQSLKTVPNTRHPASVALFNSLYE